jgi:hypothetical protein
MVGVVSVDRAVVNDTSYWKLWLRFVLALGWLLLAATISLVPSRRRPASGPPKWKLVLWFILFFALLAVVALIWKVSPASSMGPP